MATLIYAHSDNYVIGNKNKLPWPYLRADMTRFTIITQGHVALMGRKTHDSIGKLLSKRVNVVISQTLPDNDKKDNIHVYDNFDVAIDDIQETYPKKEIFIIGGKQIYNLALEKGIVDRIYRTIVHGKFEGDKLVPYIDYSEFKLIAEQYREADEDNPYSLTFKTYIKKDENSTN